MASRRSQVLGRCIVRTTRRRMPDSSPNSPSCSDQLIGIIGRRCRSPLGVSPTRPGSSVSSAPIARARSHWCSTMSPRRKRSPSNSPHYSSWPDARRPASRRRVELGRRSLLSIDEVGDDRRSTWESRTQVVDEGRGRRSSTWRVPPAARLRPSGIRRRHDRRAAATVQPSHGVASRGGRRRPVRRVSSR